MHQPSLSLRPPPSSVIAMVGNRSWSPHLKGSALPPFKSLNLSIDRDSVPTHDEHPTWSRAAFTQAFPSATFDRALWDTVLTLWRLRVDVDRSDDIWASYVLAYLRRHDFVCDGRPPFRPVLDFAFELSQRSDFPADDILESMIQGYSTSPADPNEVSQPPSDHRIPTPCLNLQPATQTGTSYPPSDHDITPAHNDHQPTIESIIASGSDGEEEDVDQLIASPDGSEGSERSATGVEATPPAADVDNPSPSPRPKRQRRQTVYVRVPARSPPSKRPAVRSPRSNKKGKPRRSSKPTTVRVPRAGDGLDMFVEEDSQVKREMIPKWEGEACEQCSETKKIKSCIPLWRYPGPNTKLRSLWCTNCLSNNDANCSFVPSKLGVRKLPKITTNVAGDIRRQRGVVPAVKPPYSDASSPFPKFNTERPPTTASIGNSRDHVESIVLADVLSFEDSLRDENRSALSLEIARIKLRAIRAAEIGSLAVLTKSINDRQEILSNLEQRFTDEIKLCAEEARRGSSSNGRR